ncbi:TetR/AcrR family transcriptional regulator [Nocardia bovistercoris]|uniref:TetR/AcrR family transcriptional regulator n=1 Tax=Nocardia bovistercoris TaxID=2785916 RepID=A0A931N2N7_9NOCA|nr:TetR/AcrR family transcriptional regulator [Nocardia bovistercoris]MBH0776917.1 TetR/AcrR family transcriptional regulator [Nocardia bovistercoris]
MTEGRAESTCAPARGTRPANRRQLVVLAAADLFYRRGYAKVGMGEVAEAVGIGPSALYRHFRGKQDLLGTVVGEAMGVMTDELAVAAPDDIARRLAVLGLEHRHVGVLWQREARHLDADRLAELRAATERIGARLAELLARRRPELTADEAALLAWCALAVTTSVSFHRLAPPEPGFTALLTELVTETIDAPIALPAAANPNRVRALATRSRREAVLAEATRLFARRGFAGVSMDDIGASVGIAGPSLYNHFAAKTEILSAVMYRGDEWLWMDMNRVFAAATDAEDGLRRLVDSYVRFVLEQPDLIQLLLSETAHLPESDRKRARSTQHSYIAEWMHLATRVHPEWDPVTARVRVQAAQTIANDVALIPRLRARAGIDAALRVLLTRLLGLRG